MSHCENGNVCLNKLNKLSNYAQVHADARKCVHMRATVHLQQIGCRPAVLRQSCSHRRATSCCLRWPSALALFEGHASWAAADWPCLPARGRRHEEVSSHPGRGAHNSRASTAHLKVCQLAVCKQPWRLPHPCSIPHQPAWPSACPSCIMNVVGPACLC